VTFTRTAQGWRWSYQFIGSVIGNGYVQNAGCTSLFYAPITVATEPGTPPGGVPFCSPPSAETTDPAALEAGGGTMLLVVPTAAEWQIENEAGEQATWRDGTFTSSIDGSQMLMDAFGSPQASEHQTIILPDDAYDMTMQALHAEMLTTSFFGQGRVIQLQGIPDPAEVFTLSVEPLLEAVRLTSEQPMADMALTFIHERPESSRIATVSRETHATLTNIEASFSGDQVQLRPLEPTTGETDSPPAYSVILEQRGPNASMVQLPRIELLPGEMQIIEPDTWDALRDDTIQRSVEYIDSARDNILPFTTGNTTSNTPLYLLVFGTLIITMLGAAGFALAQSHRKPQSGARRAASSTQRQTNELLERGIASYKAGDKRAGARMFRQVLAQDRHNQAALVWLAACTSDTTKMKQYLERAYALDPESEAGRKAASTLAKLRHGTGTSKRQKRRS
jgi:hypothetical protein